MTTSEPFTFTVEAAPAPGLSAVIEATGTQGETVAVTLVGEHFRAGAVVNVSGANVASQNVVVVSEFEITCELIIGLAAAIGARNVTVTTATGTSPAAAFTVEAAPYFLQDELNGLVGTGLKAHPPDIGGAWLDAPGYAASNNTTLDGAGGVSPNLSAGFANAFINATVPGAADYYVEIGHKAEADAGSGIGFGLGIRNSAAVDTKYLLHRNTPNIEIYRVVNGASTLLASYALAGAEVPSSANEVVFRLECLTLGNGNPRLTLYVNGVQRLQVEDNNASKIVAANRVGLRFFKVAGQTPVITYVRAGLL